MRLDDPAAASLPSNRPTVLAIAREHATEHASSWAMHGLLAALLADTPQARKMRAEKTWLIVPLEDPDGAAISHFDRMTDAFSKPRDATPPEVYAYIRYVTAYAAQGRTIDVTVSVHNVEAAEDENVLYPFAHAGYRSASNAFNEAFFKRLRDAGYLTGKAVPSAVGASSFRLYGWCAGHLGSLDLAYEVNDRYPARRLSLARLQNIGAVLGAHLADWLRADAGRERHQQARAALQEREWQRAVYLAREGPATPERARYDLLVLGY